MRAWLALVLALAGCAPPALERACQMAGAAPALRAELLFGLPESAAAWPSFLEQSVEPRFPEGLTALDAYGQWTAPDGRMSRERSKVLMIVTTASPDSIARLQAIRAEYKARFAQQSVGLVLTPACAAF